MKTKRSVLLFDSETESISQIEEVLVEKGFYVESVTNAQQLFARAESIKPSVVIANPDATGFNGDEVCTKIKHELRIPVILLIDKNSTSRDYYGNCRADDIFTKPIDFNGVVNLIEKHIAIIKD